ncbi:MAG: GFA family protein [Hyphomicrobiales bacterium]|nr:GFA family protein [Hyphomicrobiales bacterium]MCP4999969.1 GFA family protein [Hyphomicrobiales bacterium]
MGEIHEGGCVCGSVRYRAKGLPKRVSACSCEWCRKRTGSALGISVYFDDENVELLQGKLKTYRLISDAGRWIDSQFCEKCGTALTWTLEFRPGHRGLAGGTFDKPQSWFKPERYVFARTKPDWLEAPEGVTIFEAMPGSAKE